MNFIIDRMTTLVLTYIKTAATQFCMVYPEYVRHLPEVREIISDEVDSNERFATLLKVMTWILSTSFAP